MTVLELIDELRQQPEHYQVIIDKDSRGSDVVEDVYVDTEEQKVVISNF